jgi:hypothetical protein
LKKLKNTENSRQLKLKKFGKIFTIYFFVVSKQNPFCLLDGSFLFGPNGSRTGAGPSRAEPSRLPYGPMCSRRGCFHQMSLDWNGIPASISSFQFQWNVEYKVNGLNRYFHYLSDLDEWVLSVFTVGLSCVFNVYRNGAIDKCTDSSRFSRAHLED